MGFLDGFFFALGALMACALMVLIGVSLFQSESDSADPSGKSNGLRLLIDLQIGGRHEANKEGRQ